MYLFVIGLFSLNLYLCCGVSSSSSSSDLNKFSFSQINLLMANSIVLCNQYLWASLNLTFFWLTFERITNTQLSMDTAHIVCMLTTTAVQMPGHR